MHRVWYVEFRVLGIKTKHDRFDTVSIMTLTTTRKILYNTYTRLYHLNLTFRTPYERTMIEYCIINTQHVFCRIKIVWSDDRMIAMVRWVSCKTIVYAYFHTCHTIFSASIKWIISKRNINWCLRVKCN